MFARIKRSVRQLRGDAPGERFQRRYDRARKAGGPEGWERVVLIVLAVVATAIGIVLVFIPGPAILFFFIAGGLLATESRKLAKALDWSELKTRALCGWLLRRVWGRA